MHDPEDGKDNRGNDRPRKQAGVCAREPERDDYGDDSEAELAEAEEAILLTQACPLGFQRGEPFAVDAPWVRTNTPWVWILRVQAGCGASTLGDGRLIEDAVCKRRTTRSRPSASMTVKSEGATA
ncbi:MAG TPA: hypothetical protein VHW01_16930, partial [Polyangiaceae bacterium]|nr:hypothetical protein [Polyangiaceae bacterium]